MEVDKLILTLYDKKNYVIHYRLLQLYVELGVQITKIHRILSYKQERWMEPYISSNTESRKNLNLVLKRAFGNCLITLFTVKQLKI